MKLEPASGKVVITMSVGSRKPNNYAGFIEHRRTNAYVCFDYFISISAESSLVCCWPDYIRAICSQWHRAEHSCIADSVNHRVHDRLGADSIVADADCGTPGTTAYHQRQQIGCAQMQRRERGRGRGREKETETETETRRETAGEIAVGKQDARDAIFGRMSPNELLPQPRSGKLWPTKINQTV